MPKGDGKSEGLSKGTAERTVSDHVQQGRQERQKAQNGPKGEVEIQTRVGRKGDQGVDDSQGATSTDAVDGQPSDGGVSTSFTARR